MRLCFIFVLIALLLGCAKRAHVSCSIVSDLDPVVSHAAYYLGPITNITDCSSGKRSVNCTVVTPIFKDSVNLHPFFKKGYPNVGEHLYAWVRVSNNYRTLYYAVVPSYQTPAVIPASMFECQSIESLETVPEKPFAEVLKQAPHTRTLPIVTQGES